MSRRLAACLAACLAVPALALAADGDPKKRLTAVDQAKARSIVLTRADFATGWKRIRMPDDNEELRCPGFEPDESDLTLTGEAEAEFEHSQGLPYVTSFATVYVSQKDAVASWTRSVKPVLVRCIAHFFREGIAAEGRTVKIVKQGRISFPRVAPRTAAFRVAARVSMIQAGKTVTVPFTIHLVALGRGRADVGMLTMALGPGIPTAELRAFARLLASRLQKAGV